jgi:CTP-dependent riboflavin kinase
VIVTGYNILEIKQVSKKGTVKIKFQEIAERVKDKKAGRVILLKKKQESEVIYDLILKNGNWVVLDPPEPRISLQAITSQFEDQMKILNSSNWQKTAGMDQEQIRNKKEIYSNFKSAYEEVKSLK